MGKAILFRGGGSGVPVDEMTNPATASDVYSGNTFATKDSDELLTGNVQNKTTSHTQTLNETWTIPAGFLPIPAETAYQRILSGLGIFLKEWPVLTISQRPEF